MEEVPNISNFSKSSVLVDCVQLTSSAMVPAPIPDVPASLAKAEIHRVTVAVRVVAFAEGDARPTSLAAVEPTDESIAGAQGGKIGARTRFVLASIT